MDRTIIMPTILREGPYRFYFYSNEHNEPPHVHVDRENASAKFWLNPVTLASNIGFKTPEVRKINYLVIVNRLILVEAWHEHFGA